MSVYTRPLESVEMELAGRPLKLESGRFAHQAGGSIMVSYGDTVVQCTVTAGEKPREGCDWFPLMVDYEEKFYAAGKINGSRFIKREGRPSENATLSSRLIDRPLRPMFPKYMRNDVQIICTVLSADLEVHPGTTALIGASAACLAAGMPIEAAVSGVRVGLKDGKPYLSPTYEEAAEGDLDLVVAGSEDAVMMVEARAKEVPEETMIAAIELAHKHIKEICQLQDALMAKLSPTPFIHTEAEQSDMGMKDEIKGMISDADLDAASGKTKKEFKKNVKALQERVVANFIARIEDEEDELSAGDVEAVVMYLVEQHMRKNILEKELRLDGRGIKDVRPLFCEVGMLPRTHGSGMFQRGETQVLNVCTLAGPGAAQIIDTMDQDTTRRYMHHYNFPGYCVGEVKPMRSPGRREIGHGILAERALLAVLPPVEDFPYTMRTVSEVMACNGSSSMASVCGSTLSLMDAGVPLKAPVAGIAMGLVMGDDGNYKILSDIQGMEDFNGDMDLKVTGTDNGITAMQMDIKLKGLDMSLLREAVAQANEGRAVIMAGMLEAISAPRTEMSPYAPVIESMMIDPDKIREVIGKGGETIQKITAETETEIDIEQTGQVSVTAPNREKADAAMAMIAAIVAEPEVGMEYDGTVVNVMDFGAFVEFMPGKQGLVHISKWSKERIENMADVAKEGDKVRVRLAEIDRQGRNNLVRVEG